MSTESDIPTPYFIVDPENRPLVSGEISFIERSQQLRQKAFIIFAFALISGVVMWMLFSGFGNRNLEADFFLSAILAVSLLASGIPALNKAQHHLQLENGQFIDGEIISSEVYSRSTGRSPAFFLNVTYHFQTPEGRSFTGTAEASRQDLLHQAETRYPKIHDINPSEEDYKRLQEFAPPVNTPVKIRYVDDNLFRVM